MPLPWALAALTAPAMVLSPATPSTVTRSAPALNASPASSSPASIVLRSANTILSGCASLIAVMARKPSALISGVPSSMMSTLGAAAAASSRAASVVRVSMANCSFMWCSFVGATGPDRASGYVVDPVAFDPGPTML